MKRIIVVQALMALAIGGCDKDEPGMPVDTSTDSDAAVDTVADVPADTAEPTPGELCEALVVVTCERAFECYLPEHIAAVGWTTTDDCEADFHERLDCATAGTCPAGETYSNALAAQCVEDMRVQSCGDLIGGNMPVSCEQMCQ